MNTFAKLKLKNFQAHASLELELDPHVTTIVGDNDVGKSACLRALGLVSLNRPGGTEFIRWGKKLCRVDLTLSDGTVVTRERGEKANRYLLDGESFAAFGAGKVPDPVAAALNVGEINFQSQLDPPFWFLESAGQVSKNLNAVVNLGVIDKALADVAGELRRSRAAVEVSEDRLKEAKAKKESLAWVPGCRAALTALQATAAAKQEAGQSAAELAVLVAGLRRCRAALKTAEAMGEAWDAVAAAHAEHTAAAQDRKQLEHLLQKTRKARAVAARPMPDVGPLVASRDRANKLAERRRALEMLLNQLTLSEQKKWEAEDALEKEKVKMTEAQERLGLSKCPSCGRPTPSPSSSATST